MINKIPLLIFGLLCYSNLFSQETVYLEASEKGRGILKSRNGTCFVICPGHVVQDVYGDVSIIGDRFRTSKGELLKTFDSDLAVLRIKSGEEQNCQAWSISNQFNIILDQVSEGMLEIRSDIGSVSNLPVTIIEYDEATISIRLKNEGSGIAKGMSGSSLFVAFGGSKVYMGMLLEVSEGIGIVLQSDNMDRILFDFFNIQFDTAPLDTSSAIQNDRLKINLRNSIQKDLEFLESYYTESLNSNNNYLKLKIGDFLKSASERYKSYPPNLTLEPRKEAAYRSQVAEINLSIHGLINLFNKSKNNWDRDSIPMISMLLLQISEIKALLN